MKTRAGIWIIEVKGNFNASGASENIDIFAAKKADALNAYCKRHHALGGFVCYSEEDDELLIATTGFSENRKYSCWKLLDDEIR